MSIGLNPLLVGSAALLAVGAFAVVARRSVIASLFGVQFMLLAGGLAFVAFGRFGLGAQNSNAAGTMALLAGATAVGELAIGLAMAALLYRERRSFALEAERG
jgi:NADH-quinone oxidoreductase subunit K